MTASIDRTYRPVAMTSRSGFDESVHFGAAVGLDREGAVAFEVGRADQHVYPRSSCKPVQADAMVRGGWVGTTEQLALACASHSGTERHQAVARSTLFDAGLTETDLQNTPDLPLDDPTADEHLRAGGTRSSICQNCSGKHAAMLATCMANGWSIESYLEPEHPLQLAITDHMERLAGPVVHIGVDGCGAPAHVVPLSGIAQAFRTLAMERGNVWAAMTAHPELVGDDARDDTRLMRAVPGLMAKVGAEGVIVAAVPDGRAVAVKIGDGSGRAAGVVAADVLRQLDIDVPDGTLTPSILGHGRPVGVVRSLIGVS